MTKQVSVLQILAKKSNLVSTLAAGPQFSLLGLCTGKPGEERIDAFAGTLSEFEGQTRDAYASYITKTIMLENYNSAIILANNMVRVEVEGRTVTVAEAISSRKILQTTYQAFVKTAQLQLSNVTKAAQHSRNEVEAQVEKQKAALSTGGKVASEETLVNIRADIERNNLRRVIDPLKVETLLAKFREKYEALDQAFNLAIQEANATVKVTLDDRGFVDLDELRSRMCP